MDYVNGNREEGLYQIYKSNLRKSVEANTRAKRAYEQKLGKNIKEDGKSFFAYVNSKKRSNNSIGPLKNSNGEVLNDSKETAALLNSYFASGFTKENYVCVPEPVRVFKGPQSECFV